jgi:hypothetical protein
VDWFDILLPLLLIGIPLLGKLLERQAPPLEEGEELEPLPPAHRPRVFQGEDVNGYPDGWGEWPVEEEEGIHTLEAVSLEPVAPEPVPVRVERPVPAAVPETREALQADREAEHERFQQRILENPAGALPHVATLGGELRDAQVLRRAVLLAEVLGPPRALQE